MTHLVAHVCDLKVGEFIHTFGDLHIYSNHLEQVNELLSREALPLPKLEFVNAVNNRNEKILFRRGAMRVFLADGIRAKRQCCNKDLWIRFRDRHTGK